MFHFREVLLYTIQINSLLHNANFIACYKLYKMIEKFNRQLLPDISPIIVSLIGKSIKRNRSVVNNVILLFVFNTCKKTIYLIDRVS